MKWDVPTSDTEGGSPHPLDNAGIEPVFGINGNVVRTSDISDLPISVPPGVQVNRTSEASVEKLEGSIGSTVTVELVRAGSSEPINFATNLQACVFVPHPQEDEAWFDQDVEIDEVPVIPLVPGDTQQQVGVSLEHDPVASL